MDAWDGFSRSPDVKLEISPPESLMSAPSDMFSPLFAVGSEASSTCGDLTTETKVALNKSVPFRSLTPSSGIDDNYADEVDAVVMDEETSATATSVKKQTKKRKSWGQVLPEPKTNLPPRKRAKTEDEKEQRRVERVLRNRRAAQSSRERKRLEVEALEQRNKELEVKLLDAQKENMVLMQRLSQVEGRPSALNTSTNHVVTFSQELFSSQNGHTELLNASKTPMDGFPATINPVSLSPTLDPIPDSAKADEIPIKAEPLEHTNLSKENEDAVQMHGSNPPGNNVSGTTPSFDPSCDKTQRPAVTLCHDLQCLSMKVPQTWRVLPTPPPESAALSQLTTLLIISSAVISVCSRPVTQIALSLKAGYSIPQTPAILNSIIWLVTRSSSRYSARTSTSATTSMPTVQTSRLAEVPSPLMYLSSRPNQTTTTLRLRVLRKILTSNPILARPLADATMRVLRLVCSEKPVNVRGHGLKDASVDVWQQSRTGIAADGSWLDSATLPSKETLMALLWVLRVEERIQKTATGSRAQGDYYSQTGRLRMRRQEAGLCENGHRDRQKWRRLR